MKYIKAEQQNTPELASLCVPTNLSSVICHLSFARSAQEESHGK
jgi:hypothetical protein